MKCPECNSEIQAEDKFCRECGAKISPICPNCGCEVSHKDKFCPECGTKLGESTKTEKVLTPPKLEDMRERLYIPESIRQRRDAAELEIQGENRLVTALFADISGFSHLSNQHSSEKVVNIVNDCFKIIVDTVFRYEGDPNRFIGDNVLAFFGAPITHENDPERAIMAALEMRDKVKELSLNISIGMNTGMMYFGPIGTREHLEVSAYGPDINLAKRLQETANPDQILIGSGTYKFTKRIFDFSLMPNLSVKGFDDPVTAYEVSKVKAHPEKLRGIDGLYAGMVGRDREYAELMDSVSQWLSGNGQMVSIIGEAGIGKSRLVKELKSYLTTKHTPNPSNTPLHPSQEGNHNPLNPPLLRGNSNSPFEKGGWGDLLYLEGRCVSIGQPISYWPFIDILRTLFDFKEDDSERDIAQKVREGITKLFPNKADDILPFIGHLMSIRFGDDLDRKLDGYSSEQIRHQTMVRLRDIFTALARQNPLLLIIEDLHWSDDLSLDLISLLMDELMTTQMMIVCVYRPEQEHRCMKLSSLAQRKCFENFTEIQLQKLSKVQSSQLVQSLLTIDALPEKVREIILLKSEGNPFFIEEVIRSLIDKGLVYKDGDKWITKVDISDISVPDTIHGVIMERIDRLESETKYVLQCASVIGRLFKYRLLDHLMSHERRLEQYLDELESKDLVYEERSIPELEYTFKHALTQEATYQTILEQRQKAFHRQVAEGIERLYSDRLEEFYEELVHHWEISGDKEKTLDYLIKAGQKASKNYLNETAVEYYTRAIELAKDMGISGDRLAEIYDYRGSLYNSIMFYEESISDLMDALSLYTNPQKRASVCALLSKIYFFSIYDIEESALYARKALSEVDPMSKSRETAEVYKNAALVFLDVVDPAEGRRYLRKAISISEEMGYKDMIASSYALLNFYGNGLHLNYEESQIAFEKALSYLPYAKSNLPEYAFACLVHGFAVEGNERIYFWQEAIEAGIRSEATWIVVRTAVSLGNFYASKGEIHKAGEVYEQAWQFGVYKRFIFRWFLSFTADVLIDFYTLNNEHRKILDMMWQMIDSTRILHGKPKVYPTVLRRWNDQVERIYKKLWDSAPQSYHDLENALESSLKETDSNGEMFFYLGQLTLLALLSKRKEQAETYLKELIRLKSGAGSFADRISGKLRIFIEILKVGSDQRLISFRELFKSVANLDGFQDACECANLILPTELAREIIDWTQFNHIALGHLKKQVGTELVRSLIKIQRISKIYGGMDNLRLLSKDIEQTVPDALKREGITYPILEFLGNMELHKPDFLDDFVGESLSPDWEWVNPAEDCPYILLNSGVEIYVTEGHDLWGYNLDGPRLIREASGDFIIETYITNGLQGKKSGGLFVWKDKDNFIRFETPQIPWENTIYYGANVNGNFIHPGVHFYDKDKAWLRLERKGDRFTGYVSSDGENWYRCGWVDIPMEDPIKVGIHALCPQLPLTSSRFEYFKIYRG